MINERVSLEEYIKARKDRDDQLKAPRYLHPSLQVREPMLVTRAPTSPPASNSYELIVDQPSRRRPPCS